MAHIVPAGMQERPRLEERFQEEQLRVRAASRWEQEEATLSNGRAEQEARGKLMYDNFCRHTLHRLVLLG